MMKNAFYFALKALFVLKILVMYKNGLIRKIRLFSKFMTSQPGKQTIVIHILPNISRSRSNQRMKFGQLIEYYMRKIFLEKSCIKCGIETIPDHFLKIEHISEGFIQFVFIICHVEGYPIKLKLSCRPLPFTSY